MPATRPILREPGVRDDVRARTLLALHARLGTASGRTMVRFRQARNSLGTAGTKVAGAMRVRGGAV